MSGRGIPGSGFGPRIPLGGISVGRRIMYPDLTGGLHPTPGDAIRNNQRVEGDFSRGASGGCNQNPGKVPNKR